MQSGRRPGSCGVVAQLPGHNPVQKIRGGGHRRVFVLREIHRRDVGGGNPIYKSRPARGPAPERRAGRLLARGPARAETRRSAVEARATVRGPRAGPSPPARRRRSRPSPSDDCAVKSRRRCARAYAAPARPALAAQHGRAWRATAPPLGCRAAAGATAET